MTAVADAVVATAESPARARGTRRTPPPTRGQRQSALFRMRADIPPGLGAGLAVGGVVALLGGWTLASAAMDTFLFPTPAATWDAGVEWWRKGDLTVDLTASVRRIAIGYSISVVLGVVFGVLMASFRSAESFLEPQTALLRYIPASALTPLFLVWLGIDESPKITLIIVGTVFFNVLMVADVARAVPQEEVDAAYTLGAGRLRVLRQVVLPHSWPGIVDVARINLAAGWLMLVVAELLAADEGLAFRMVRAGRFRRIDTMFAVLVVFALIGLISDMSLRQLRKRTAPWSEGSR
ncbi:MAG TPA: ABC transporter permease [Iamia sp.]|nr:ABC transporter permease [Iamia sp.]